MYFVFILVGALIILLGVKQKKKEKGSFTELLHKEELDIDTIDIVIGEIRMEFSSTILELQKDVMLLSERLDGFTKHNPQENPSKSEENIEKVVPTKEAPRKNAKVKIEEAAPVIVEAASTLEVNESENKNSSKIEEISKLFDRGFSIDEICEQVQMGRGEILLIKELYLK